MRIFRLFEILIVFLAFAMSLNSCEEISHGQQRRKFEFLYKMNNFGTIFREYTNDVVKFSDLQLYETRMNKLYADVNNFETVEGWGKSKILKEESLNAIDMNLSKCRAMLQKQAMYREFIKDEYDIILMRETANEFNRKIEDEIIIVGKE